MTDIELIMKDCSSFLDYQDQNGLILNFSSFE